MLCISIQNTYFGGVIIGNLIGGPASDIFGRRPTILTFTLILLIVSHSLAFIDNYTGYLIARCIVGGSAHAIFAVLSVSIIEIVPIEKRSSTMTVLQIGWIIGNGALAGLGYFLKNLVDIQVGIALINLPMICFFFCISESPRWLLVMGQQEKARKIFHDIAKWNRADMSEGFLDEFNEAWTDVISSQATNEVTEVTFKSHIRSTVDQVKVIIGSPIACQRFFLCIFPWFVAGLAYYGIFLSVKLVKVDKYMLVLVACLSEIVVVSLVNWIANQVITHYCTYI